MRQTNELARLGMAVVSPRSEIACSGGAWWAVLTGLAVALMLVASCSPPVFHCVADDECVDGGRAGRCLEPGYCAFVSSECPTGWSWADRAAPGLQGSCVPVAGTSGDVPGPMGDGSSTSTSTSTSDDVSPDGSGSTTRSDAASTTESSACAPHTACSPDDPCAVEGECDALGECTPTVMVICDDPPDACHGAVGTCDETGACVYPLQPAGEACDDGDPCTVGDACDNMGVCVSGASCPSDDPCNTSSCVEGQCVTQPLNDGTSCGEEPAMRCCGGTCVDISSDPEHCGGCQTACAPGLQCESISATDTCEVSPTATSGRCRCEYSNAQCPHGQLCRTYSPYTDRCVPANDDNCDGVALFQNSCPSFCSYE